MRVGILRTSSFPSNCNCCCGRNWSCCRRHARCFLSWTEKSHSLFSSAFHTPSTRDTSNSPRPTAATSGSRFAGHPLSPATEGGPLSLTDFSLHVICALLSVARDPPLHTLTDKKETLRITAYPGEASPLTRGCVL